MPSVRQYLRASLEHWQGEHGEMDEIEWDQTNTKEKN